MASDHITRWRLIIEEYGPDMHYIPGPENTVADTMSRIPVIDVDIKVKQSYARRISTMRGSFTCTGDITKE